MKKSFKITLVVISIIIGIILLDTAQAILFNNSPIIKVTKTYSSFHKKDVGILVETDIYSGITQRTYFKWETNTLPIKENTEGLKDAYDKVNEYFGNENVDRSNLGGYSKDEENNQVIVALVNNSKEKQEEFIRQTNINSRYIKFIQGGPYSVSQIDVYLLKSEVHNSNKFNDYYNNNGRTIYLAGNIDEFYIINGSIWALKDFILNVNQTFDRSIEEITNKLENKDILSDGGTIIYKSKEKDITMVVCNTLDKNKVFL